MKMKIVMAAIAALLLGCSTNPNGNYIIYSAEPRSHGGFGTAEDNFDYEASELLSERFMGKRLKLEYNPDYVIINDGGPELVLQRTITANDTVYRSTRQEGDQKMQFDLYMKPKRESNILVATATWTRNETDSTGQQYLDVKKVARTRCQFKKREDN